MTNEPFVVEKLSAGYGGGAPVVHDLDLEVQHAEVVALLGPNGAGKTTALMAMAGFLPDTQGVVRLGSQVLTGPAYRRCRSVLGVVVEGRSVVPGLTVRQNFVVAGVNAADGTDMFPELARRLDVPAGMLSGGEQQMLALARAIARRPQVLLIDEVSFGLAPITCSRLFAALRDVVTSRQLTVVLVEQHLNYAAEVADRAVIMVGGRTRAQMSAKELLARELEIESMYLGTAPA